jgi:alginate O-acetyltransferase complex protein AlgI
MLFQTWPFFVFFAVVYPVYLLVKGTRLRLPWLVTTSYFFYAWLGWFYLVPLIYATAVDYLVAGRIEKGLRRKAWLTLSITNDLAVLVVFKYAGFITENINVPFSFLHVPYMLSSPGVLLPAGLSFYLLQSMAYVIDVYRGAAKRQTSFLAYAAFVSFFPRLLAGPIERAGNLLPQLQGDTRITVRDFTDGLSMFVVGYFKKVALADYLAIYVTNVYGAPRQFYSPALLLATFLFAWQVYFDFSGYTDMARGIARMMGIRLMRNFDNPYVATSLRDFWHRWHISLSSWFRDYVYIPLGGNRRGTLVTHRNVVVTMMLSGLWHDAAWRFVVWGAVHGLGYCAARQLGRTAERLRRMPKILKQLLVFGFVTGAWVFFKAKSIGAACAIIARVFTSGWADPACPVLALVLIAAVWSYEHLFESRLRWVLELQVVRVTLMILMLGYMLGTVSATGTPFIYMQF